MLPKNILVTKILGKKTRIKKLRSKLFAHKPRYLSVYRNIHCYMNDWIVSVSTPNLYPGGTTKAGTDYRVIIFILTYYMGTIEPGGNYRRSATQGVQKYTQIRKQIQTHIIAKLWWKSIFIYCDIKNASSSLGGCFMGDSGVFKRHFKSVSLVNHLYLLGDSRVF